MTPTPTTEMAMEVSADGILPRIMVVVVISPGEMEVASQTRVHCTGTMRDMVVARMTDITPV